MPSAPTSTRACREVEALLRTAGHMVDITHDYSGPFELEPSSTWPIVNYTRLDINARPSRFQAKDLSFFS